MKSNQVRLPRDIIVAIKKDLKEGRSFREICEKHHVATATVRKVRELKTIPKNNQFFRADTAWPCKHSPEKLEAIKKWREEGHRVKDIAERFQVSKSYVSNIINGRERSAEK